MATHEDMNRMGSMTEAIEVASDTSEAPTASEILVENLELSTYVVNRLTDAGIKTVQDLLDRLEQGGDIEGIGGKSMEEIHEQLTELGFPASEGRRAKIEQRQKAQVEGEQAEPEAENAPPESRKEVETKAMNREPPSEVPDQETAELRVSFIVRLTLDERGQPRRTEVEHTKLGKESFSGFDVQKLVAFMKRGISPPAIPEPSIPSAPLAVSDVRGLRKGALGVRTLLFDADESFAVQARFKLGGAEATRRTTQESAFQVLVYARNVTGGGSIELTSHKGNLRKDAWEYPVEMRAPGLAPGLYRLLTLVTIGEPADILAHYDGPIIRVGG